MPEMRAVAQRIVNAETRFVAMCIEQYGFTKPDTEHILAVYRKQKIIQIDAVGGQFTFTHGAFAERSVMENALKMPVLASLSISDIPHDMQVLISDFFDIASKRDKRKRGGKLQLVRVALASLPDREIGTNRNDNRNEEYARAMIGQDTPPIIVCGAQWLDGRHRVWAARQAGQSYITAIDLEPIVGSYTFADDVLGRIHS